MRECYIRPIRSINLIIKDVLAWVTLKNTEDAEKWAQKKEEHVKEIRENKPLSGKY